MPLVEIVVETGVLSVDTEAAVTLGLLSVTSTKKSTGGAAIWKTFAPVRIGRSEVEKVDIRIISWRWYCLCAWVLGGSRTEGIIWCEPARVVWESIYVKSLMC
jgi:hypothetical protein